eukprot:3526144-Amphidinium_carterae.1
MMFPKSGNETRESLSGVHQAHDRREHFEFKSQPTQGTHETKVASTTSMYFKLLEPKSATLLPTLGLHPSPTFGLRPSCVQISESWFSVRRKGCPKESPAYA